MKKIIVAIFTAMFLVSCVDDVIEDKANVSQTNISSLTRIYKNKNKLESHKNLAFSGKIKRSIDEIKDIAVKAVTRMRVEEGVVTKAGVQIKSIDLVNGCTKKPYIKTKGGVVEDDVVLINFEGNQGYVLVSSDMRVPSVLGFSSQGNLGDLTNPGVSALLSRIPFFIRKRIGRFEAVKPQLKKAKEEDLFKRLSNEKKQDLISRGFFDRKGERIVRKFGVDELHGDVFNDVCDDRGYHRSIGLQPMKYKKRSLLKTLWSQRGLYNDLIETPDCDKPVGCLPLAVAQIMAYHKAPSVFKGRKMHWDEMTSIESGHMFSQIDYLSEVGKKDVRHLLAKLGDKDLLNAVYGCQFTSASNEDAVKLFRKFDYTVSDLIAYDSDKMILELRNGRPLYMYGASIKEVYSDDGVEYKNAHAWVVDGQMNMLFFEYDAPCNPLPGKYYVKENIEIIDKELFIHNNFGWGGSSTGVFNPDSVVYSGWYLEGIFNAVGGPQYTPDEIYNYKVPVLKSLKRVEGEINNYQYLLHMITVKK